MINSSKVLTFIILCLLYKNLLLAIAPIGFAFKILIMVLLGILLVDAGISFLTNYIEGIKSDIVSITVTLNCIFILGLTVKAILGISDIITSNFIILAFNQVAIQALIAFSICNLMLDYDAIFRNILKYSWPIVIFAIFEMFLPVGLKTYFIDKMNIAKFGSSSDIDVSAYIFQDFGVYLYRSGSLFFEPLTLSFFTAELVVIAYLTNYRPKLPILLANIVSIGKSGFVIIISSIIANVLKRSYSYVFAAMFVCLVLFFATIVVNFDETELAIIFFTASAHIMGLFSGVINGTNHPFLGHGLGTAGYLVYIEALATNNMDVFNNAENLIIGNGNESFIGIIIYQLGYIYFVLYTFMFYTFARKLISMKQFAILGFMCAYYLVGYLTESVATLLPMILSYLIIFSAIGRRPIFASPSCSQIN